MTNTPRMLSQFKISDDNLRKNKAIADAYENYDNTRDAFCDSRKELNEAIKNLHDLLDGPLRLAGLVTEGKDWTFKDDQSDGLFIQVWAEPRQRGRRKSEVPTQQVSFSLKEGKAA